MSPSLEIHVSALTDVGMTRDHNEDCFLLWNMERGEPVPGDGEVASVPAREGLLVAVCDGMGGAAAGEKASALTVETLQVRAEEVEADRLQDIQALGDWLVESVVEADRRILREATEHPEMEGMGSTCTSLIFVPDGLTLAHVGDSRAYHLRGETLRQISVDHSYVGELVAMGQITAEEARTHDQRNLLLQVLGLGRELDVDRVRVEMKSGDKVMLCSDGLYDLVEDGEIRLELTAGDDPAVACRNLVDLANERGGKDNITVVVARAG